MTCLEYQVCLRLWFVFVLCRCLSSRELLDVMMLSMACFTGRRHETTKGVTPCTAPTAAAAADSSSSGSSSKKGSSSSSSGKKQKQQKMVVPSYHQYMLAAAGLEGLVERAGSMVAESNTAVVFLSVLAYLTTARYQGSVAARASGFWEQGTVTGSSSKRAGMVTVLGDYGGSDLLLLLVLTMVEHLLLAPDLEHLYSALQVGRNKVMFVHLLHNTGSYRGSVGCSLEKNQSSCRYKVVY